MRKALDIFLSLNLLAIVLGGLYLWWNGQLLIAYQSDPQTQAPPSTEQEAVLFGQTLRAAVDEQLGQPIEGYEPEMFIAVFPGLVATDFEGVEASIGKFVVVDGQLIHVTPPDVPLHSAATAVTNRGLRTLLDNISRRAQIDLTDGGTLTEVFNTISETSN